MRARELVFAGGRAWRAAQREASRKKERPAHREAKRKKERPAEKGVGTPKKKRKTARMLRDSQAVGTTRGALHEREERNDRSFAMMVSPSVLWMRTRAGVWVLVVRE